MTVVFPSRRDTSHSSVLSRTSRPLRVRDSSHDVTGRSLPLSSPLTGCRRKTLRPSDRVDRFANRNQQTRLRNQSIRWSRNKIPEARRPGKQTRMTRGRRIVERALRTVSRTTPVEKSRIDELRRALCPISLREVSRYIARLARFARFFSRLSRSRERERDARRSSRFFFRVRRFYAALL